LEEDVRGLERLRMQAERLFRVTKDYTGRKVFWGRLKIIV
jgi:hypothetical protein